MSFDQGTGLSETRRRVDLEVEDLRIFADAESLISDCWGCWDLLIPKLADTRDGDVIWTGVTRPDGEIGMYLDCEGDDDLLTQSEVDILLVYANRIRELTEDPVDNLLDVSPAWRYLASCDQISLLREGRSVPRGSQMTPDVSDLSVVIVRTLEGPDVVRVTFTDKTIRVEAGDAWTARVTAELASQITKSFSSSVLNTARLTPDEGSSPH